MYRLKKRGRDREAVKVPNRFYTRGALRSIWVSRQVEILELRKGELFELHRREGKLKDIHCSAQNATLFVDLL